jgi:DNA-binding NtrC family response regulator
VLESGFALVPCGSESEIVAALYLAQPEGLAVSDARVFGTAIAQAVLAAENGPSVSRVPDLSPTEETKLQLMSLLERNEWNVAKVARIMGVTRRTVYMRLASFGIERRHVPKIYKKLPSEG